MNYERELNDIERDELLATVDSLMKRFGAQSTREAIDILERASETEFID